MTRLCDAGREERDEVELGLARLAYVLPGGAVTYDACAARTTTPSAGSADVSRTSDCREQEAPCLDPPLDRGFAIELAEVTYVGVCAPCAGAATAEGGDAW